MRILVLYATTEGQTRKVAQAAADRLAGLGHAVERIAAADAGGIDLGRFDRAILAGSLHAGRYQPELVAFATARHAELARLPTAFLSVSLSAASAEAEDREGLESCVARFVSDTGWTPGTVEHVAGAFRFGQYDFLKAWAMRWMERRRDPGARPGADREYTDWVALDRFIDRWAASATAPSA